MAAGCDDERLLDCFIDFAADIVNPYFSDVLELRRNLRLIAEAARSNPQVWKEAGCEAFMALADGMTPNIDSESVRKWAQLLEGLLRSLVKTAGIGQPAKDDLRGLIAHARLIAGDTPAYDAVPGLLGHARSADPAASYTRSLSILAAATYRNRHAHANWSPIGWRERIEVAETVLLTLLEMVDKHRQIEKTLVFDQARTVTMSDSPVFDDQGWGWSGQFSGRPFEYSTNELVNTVLEAAWPKRSRLVLRGPVGIGLSTLRHQLISASFARHNAAKDLLLVDTNVATIPANRAKPTPNSGSSRDAERIMAMLLGDRWKTWWLQTALEKQWLGIALDGLG